MYYVDSVYDGNKNKILGAYAVFSDGRVADTLSGAKDVTFLQLFDDVSDDYRLVHSKDFDVLYRSGEIYYSSDNNRRHFVFICSSVVRELLTFLPYEALNMIYYKSRGGLLDYKIDSCFLHFYLPNSGRELASFLIEGGVEDFKVLFTKIALLGGVP